MATSQRLRGGLLEGPFAHPNAGGPNEAAPRPTGVPTALTSSAWAFTQSARMVLGLPGTGSKYGL